MDTESNHPSSIIKELPRSVELRLLQLSANEEIFKNSINEAIQGGTKAEINTKCNNYRP